MMNACASSEAKLNSLSSEKTRLLELLLEKRAATQQIKPWPRNAPDGPVQLPTSWAQQRLWFLDQIEGTGPAYNISVAVKLAGALDGEALRRALNAVVQRHEVLRTRFVDAQGDAHQEIQPQLRPSFRTIDLSASESNQRSAQVESHRFEERLARFDLKTGPLIRARLLQVAAEEHVLLLTVHHIVCDGWSMGVMLRELAHFYAAYREGRADLMPPLAIQYADYAQWQRDWLKGELWERQLQYWLGRLQGAPPELGLPTDRPRPAVQRHRGRNVPVAIDEALAVQLAGLARRHGMTLFMVLWAAWAVLLAKLSSQEDIVIGTPVANRRRPELEGLIGFFVNTLALRVQVQSDLALNEFLARVKDLTLSAYEHQDMPFEQIVAALRPQRSLDRHPIFQAMFTLQNAPQSDWQLPGLTVTMEEEISETSKFDLLLWLYEGQHGITGGVSYDSDLFDHETVERWVASFVVLLEAVALGGRRAIGELPILPPQERRRVVEVFNETHADFPRDEPIHRIFEKQAQLRPDATAVICEGMVLTYAQLNRRANQLASHLRMRGVAVGDYVPLVMNRSLHMLIAELAVLKCGAAYVPIDPNLPLQRLAFIVSDCRARRILIAGHAQPELELAETEVIDCSRVAAAMPLQRVTDFRVPLPASSPAYVMYTSGSTGTPKGVIVPHYAISRLVINNGYVQIGHDDCIAHHSNPAFDASTFEIWGALLNGARVLVVPQAVVLDAARFVEVLEQERATILWLTVGLFNQYADRFAKVFAQLRCLITGGDIVEPGAVRRVLRTGAPARFLNGYGPTECTTFTTTYPMEGVDENTRHIPIGRPIANAQVYILNSRGEPVPIGVIGELHIGGAGVAVGYLNQPELTAARFIPDPFSCDPRARLYKTGDLGRWRSDGTIEFVGRNDHQVKIRGFRIELGEIESRLAQHPYIREAAVLALVDSAGEKRLVAYVVPAEIEAGINEPTADQLRVHLKGLLPDYMVPSAFVTLPRLPLTTNGKLDRAALPEPYEQEHAGGSYQPPEGHMEEALAAVWQELLAVGRIGRDDDFFELGGHSLLAVKALFRINQQFGCTLSATDIYRSPTVRGLAARVAGTAIEDATVDLGREAVVDDDLVAPLGPCGNRPRCVLLTGATGFVGRFLLARLLEENGDMTVHCVVRAQSAQHAWSRLTTSLRKARLWHPHFERNIVAVPGDLRSPQLGLEPATYEALLRTVDTVYHCATSMNHLETYSSAKAANVDGVRELLRFATRGQPKLINYISTLSVFGATAFDRVVTEGTCIDSETHSVSSGYAASKWVGEKVLAIASARGAKCNVFRLGLVWADAQQGRYDERQREHRVLKSCLLSGYGIRGYRYETPTPVDHVAEAVVLLADRQRQGGGIFHLGSTDQQVDRVFERCNEIMGTSLELLPFYDWICEIKRLHERGVSLPIVPLIEFAFSMSEEAFVAHQRAARSTGVTRFDASRTRCELEQAGILVPASNDELLRLCVEHMIFSDPDLQEAQEGRSTRLLAAARVSPTGLPPDLRA